MKLKVIGSGSQGNAYILENDAEALIIECGVNISEIKKALGFNYSKVIGCLVTHEHQDHCKAIRDVMGAGVNVYATDGTLSALGLQSHHRAVVTFSGDQFRVGSFQVMAFSVEHDVNEPVGFLINHPECGKVLFVTDTYYCKWNFKGLNNVIIEANYSQDIMDARLRDGGTHKFLRDRNLTSHMSLQTCKDMLGANDMSAVNNIVLIHLSDGNSDAKRFKKEVEQQTGKRVHIAVPGLELPFNKTPF